MPPKFYICFDDSDHDPTYAPVGQVYLVESEYQGEDNPCSTDHASHWTSLMPVPGGQHSPRDVRAFAAILGWEVVEDAEGKLVLRTGVSV